MAISRFSFVLTTCLSRFACRSRAAISLASFGNRALAPSAAYAATYTLAGKGRSFGSYGPQQWYLFIETPRHTERLAVDREFWDAVVSSGLPFSGVRLRNARPRGQ